MISCEVFWQRIKEYCNAPKWSKSSIHGPGKKITEDTLLDRWLVGDFCAAEYTIVADLSTFPKEIVKCLVVAGPKYC